MATLRQTFAPPDSQAGVYRLPCCCIRLNKLLPVFLGVIARVNDHASRTPHLPIGKPKMAELIGKLNPVLDQGPVAPVGYNDQTIEAAHISCQRGTKNVQDDRNLHCYHPKMEVLTATGWKCWSECREYELFLVPDPHTRSVSLERLKVVSFDADEQLYTFASRRMSYQVTSRHKMRFRSKPHENFGTFRAEEMPRWGHFDPFRGYALVDPIGALCPRMQLIGFFLGDGSWSSPNTVGFHLKKSRKKKYLESLCRTLGVTYEKRNGNGSVQYWLSTPAFFHGYLRYGERSRDKTFPMDRLPSLDQTEIRGLLDGLTNSDGSLKMDRPQVKFSSISESLLTLYETVCAYQGIDAHRTKHTGVTAYRGSRTTLESRIQYHGRKAFKGCVYCTRTSTGWLIVRGARDEFGFVCGNTSSPVW